MLGGCLHLGNARHRVRESSHQISKWPPCLHLLEVTSPRVLWRPTHLSTWPRTCAHPTPVSRHPFRNDHRLRRRCKGRHPPRSTRGGPCVRRLLWCPCPSTTIRNKHHIIISTTNVKMPRRTQLCLTTAYPTRQPQSRQSRWTRPSSLRLRRGRPCSDGGRRLLRHLSCHPEFLLCQSKNR